MLNFIGTAQKDNESQLYYTRDRGNLTFYNVVASANGFEFSEKGKYVIITDEKGREEKKYDWSNLRVAKQADSYYLFYKQGAKGLTLASSQDLIRIKKLGKIEINETATLVPEYKHKDQFVMYFGETSIKVAYSQDLTTWKIEEKAVLEPRKNKFDFGELEVVNAYESNGHILLPYYVKTKNNTGTNFLVGAAIFDKANPTKIIWRSEEPLWEPPEELKNEKLQPLGSVILHNELIFYFLVNDNSIFAVSCQIPDKHTGLKNKIFSTLFKKAENNPIIAPDPTHPWESRATFNSAAVYEDGKVHFVYRALGDKDLSVLGYATSKDGLNIDERSEEPIYIPREPFETPGQQVFKTFADHFASGGGYGGIEDPRITKVDNRFFMTYVAFDGANPPRVALTSISIEDFLNKNWDRWDKPKLISAPGMVNKNAVIFPEKINGKFVVFHRIYPNVLIDYVDDLNFDNGYLQGHHFIPPRKKFWDSKKIGAGAPPIKTKDGWLFIYQSVGYQDPGKYKVGAMLLDKNNPSKVLYRANSPIVEPNEHYENAGFKAGVVYPCGAVTMDNKLHVYYGGADTVVCAASTDLDRFLWELKRNQEPKLKRVATPVIN
jgi:predicted GH43/DUF377 family glycosyl hydrolase